jgi:alpha-tubulin suppressor-like RCC1 family protein
MMELGRMSEGRAHARLFAGGLLCAALLAGCAERGSSRGWSQSVRGEQPAPLRCAEPAEGCACAGNQPPVACRPEGAADAGAGAAAAVCLEGTRYCRNGRFGECEQVVSYARNPATAQSALLDPGAMHQQCSDCEPNCFRVVDNFDPADGKLDPSFATGVEYHSSGAGLTLTPDASIVKVGPVDGGVPDGALYLQVAEGLTDTDTHTSHAFPARADVYLLLDQSSSMAEETQWLYDQFDTGAYLGPNASCVGGDPSLADAGVAGALRCLISSPELGLGTFRELPFELYASDQSVPAAQRIATANKTVAYANVSRQRGNLARVKTAFSQLGGAQPSGDPDVAGSQIPALHALVSGQGMFTGIGAASVADGPPCRSGRFGYPCFRAGARPVVVMVTGVPLHNGPDPSTYPYDYDPAALGMLEGTTPGVTGVPSSSSDWGSAFALGSDAASTLSVLDGTTSSGADNVPASVIGCQASDPANDAIFRFDVTAPGPPGSTARVAFSTQGSSLPTALAVFDAPVLPAQPLPAADDQNELFASAYAIGDVAARPIVVSGDTTKPADASADMSADYQGSLLAAACGANSLAPDAVFAFNVSAASAPTGVELSLDMGTAHPVLAVYEQGTGLPPRWPALANPLMASGNSDASPSRVFTIPSGTGNEYVSVVGDSSTLSSDYDQSVLGGAVCNPDSASRDAAFQIHVDATRRLRFDTEGSSFDTVLSLHRSRPLARTGSVVTWTAAQTHSNHNESAATAYATGSVNGLHQIFQGDTSAMTADVTDAIGCGTGDSCAEAVYAIDVSARTTLRFQISGQGYEPGVLVTRADPAGVSGRYVPLALGADHSCALSGGTAYCWGADGSGQLGNGGGAGDPDSQSAVAVAVTGAIALAAGTNQSCAVTAAGAVYCWGAGGTGQLGDGGSVDRYAPVQVVGIGGSGTLGNAVQVACGAAHCCALARDGSIACWGDDSHGQLGDNRSGAQSATPVAVSSAEVFEQIAANGDQSCAIRRSDKAVYCWGSGAYGKLGDGATADNLVPMPVTGVDQATHVMVGEDHACAVLATGHVLCWGRGAGGRLGQGTDAADHATPVAVKSADGTGQLANAAGGWAAGRAHTCVSTLTGLVQCWGDDALHQLGDGASTGSGLPVSTLDLVDVQEVVSSHDHSCALRASGALACWGDDAHGKLGDGSTVSPLRPVASQSGAPQVAFGTGTLDVGFTQACRSIGQAPQPDCRRTQRTGRSYFVCDGSQRTWSGAGAACAAVGYELADIDAAGENAFLAGELSAASWIGAKRSSSPDWLTLASGYDFADLQGQQIWHTEQVGHDQCFFGFFCNFVPTRGFFTSAAAPDLVDSRPYRSASTWGADDEPSANSGRNCALLKSNGHWATDVCALGSTPAVVAGSFAAPPFAGGVEHDFACEEDRRFTDVTLDPGKYFVTVKGVPSVPTAGACSGSYALQIDDLGSPNGGFMTCDDNGVAETTASAIEQVLTPGDYYLVLKGKHQSDAGPYRLTVRDLDAVAGSEIACDAGQGPGDPASVRFMAQPGKSYYALVKGDAPLDKGPYTLSVRADTSAGHRLACDASSGVDGASALDLQLQSGTYYAVLSSRDAGSSGAFRLTVGGASPVSSTFVPPSYDDTLAALGSHDIRVGTVLSCAAPGASCDDAQAQASLLAQDTGGTVRVAPSAADVPQKVVEVVQSLEAFDTVRAQLVFAPDADPGFVKPKVSAVAGPGCQAGSDGSSLSACVPGSSPSFSVSLTNPALNPVPPPSGPLGAYQFTLHVEGTRAGGTELSEDVPVLVTPTGAAPPMTYRQGSYFQDLEDKGCGVGENTRPSWDGLRFNADVRPDTRLVFYACTADSVDDLSHCPSGGLSSGYKRVATVTAGQGAGTACSVMTQDVDCPDGYCSPYTSVCNYIEGASCTFDRDCPGTAAGRCRAGPSAMTLGNTCAVPDLIASPASALAGDNYRVALRLRFDLESLGDQSRTPALFSWQTQYRCHNVE